MSENLVDTFITKIIEKSDYQELDRIYLTNRILALVGDDVLSLTTQEQQIIPLKEALVDQAVYSHQIDDSLSARDQLGANLMDFITPPPSQVNHDFWQTYQHSPERAIADFYQASRQNDYIKVDAIAKNIAYEVATDYGDLEITINLSKPEKDPKAIAAAKTARVSHYPACQLCVENEGYQGRIDHPARANHRIIRFVMDDHDWGFQYSPYAYFNEHCIFLDTQHVPMAVSRSTFERLLHIVSIFPGYFAGSNADLPIVGGSILTHDHYQGGRHHFPMEKAEVEKSFIFDGFDEVQAGIVKWPMSVIRLRSSQPASLSALADKILQQWREYSDTENEILAYSHGEPHHTITPIARRKENGDYELDLVLRDNQTSAEYPDGIYHPHPDVQHIKKENIGLIEVMGLAILPPRLKTELEEVEDFLLGKRDQVAKYHQSWAQKLKKEHPNLSEKEAKTIVQLSVGEIFARVLEDAGVYKRTPKGQEAFMAFIRTIGVKQGDN